MQVPLDDPSIDTHILNETVKNSVLSRYLSNIRFGEKALSILQSICPRIIHVQGLDMLEIAYKYKRKYDGSVKIIYEVADLHSLLVDAQPDILHKLIQWYLRRQDRTLAPKSDLLIVTSDFYYKSYFSNFIKENAYLYLPNIPDLNIFSHYEKKEAHAFTIGYIGIIRYKEQISQLIDVCMEERVPLLIAGYEQGENVIETKCANNPDIDWIGRFNFDKEASQLYEKCSAIYAVYDADMSNVRVALPNKLYESVYCELPIIVAKNTYLASIVEEWGVGIAVNHKDSNELVSAIRSLMDPVIYSRYVKNCRNHKKDIDSNKYAQFYYDKLCTFLEKE